MIFWWHLKIQTMHILCISLLDLPWHQYFVLSLCGWECKNGLPSSSHDVISVHYRHCLGRIYTITTFLVSHWDHCRKTHSNFSGTCTYTLFTILCFVYGGWAKPRPSQYVFSTNQEYLECSQSVAIWSALYYTLKLPLWKTTYFIFSVFFMLDGLAFGHTTRLHV
jgi:hypothetical protein